MTPYFTTVTTWREGTNNISNLLIIFRIPFKTLVRD